MKGKEINKSIFWLFFYLFPFLLHDALNLMLINVLEHVGKIAKIHSVKCE